MWTHSTAQNDENQDSNEGPAHKKKEKEKDIVAPHSHQALPLRISSNSSCVPVPLKG